MNQLLSIIFRDLRLAVRQGGATFLALIFLKINLKITKIIFLEKVAQKFQLKHQANLVGKALLVDLEQL